MAAQEFVELLEAVRIRLATQVLTKYGRGHPENRHLGGFWFKKKKGGKFPPIPSCLVRACLGL